MRGRASEQHGMWVFYDPESLIAEAPAARGKAAHGYGAGGEVEGSRRGLDPSAPAVPILWRNARVQLSARQATLRLSCTAVWRCQKRCHQSLQDARNHGGFGEQGARAAV